MRNKPNYDWGWFNSRAPFKKIFEEICNLKVKKEIHYLPVYGNIKQRRNYYVINVNYNSFVSEFDRIKDRLLHTNICKNCAEVYEMVSEMECDKTSLCELIIEGCIPNCEGTFEWFYD